MKIHNRFAIVKLWDTICAEDEIIMRIVATAKSMRLECVPVDHVYRYLSDKTKIATEKDFDFVLHLHFDAVKINSLFSFVTLWNPTQFYFDWNYRQFSDNILTHDDFLTSRSEGAERHLHRLIYKDAFHLPPEFALFPSSSTHIFQPELRTDKKLHYCGINWDRIDQKEGRYAKTLHLLDNEGMLDIYGPHMLGRVKVWDGFKCYRGELPFDGFSMIESLRRAGVALVLSSPAHIESGLMSNRLFEALAAGVNIISDENSFVRRYLGENARYIDSKALPELIAAQVCGHLSWFNNNPDEALQMAENSQKIFDENFNLKTKLQHIYDNLAHRKHKIQVLYDIKDHFSMHVCYLFATDDISRLENVHDSIENNQHKSIQHYIYCTKQLASHIESLVKKFGNVTIIDNVLVNTFQDTDNRKKIYLGPILKHFFDLIPDDAYFSIVMYYEKALNNHFSSLIKTILNNDCDTAYSNYIETYGEQENNKAKAKSNFKFSGNIIHHSNFIFSKKNYLETYKLILPDIDRYIFGYLYLFAKSIHRSNKFSCIIDINKNNPDFKLYEDRMLLKDLKMDDKDGILRIKESSIMNQKIKPNIFIRILAVVLFPLRFIRPVRQFSRRIKKRDINKRKTESIRVIEVEVVKRD